jgi:glycolate oxidase
VEAHARLGIDHDAAAMLIAQSDTGNVTELELMREACESAGAQLVYVTEDRDEGVLLLKARRLAYPALEKLGSVMIDDLSVPLAHLPEMLRRIDVAAAEHDVLVATVAHAGDGNIHPLIVFDERDEDSRSRARAVFERLMLDAVQLGGTISGEHGIGTLKADFLFRQLGVTSMQLHQAVKRAFDPFGILNPGKLLNPTAPSLLSLPQAEQEWAR